MTSDWLGGGLIVGIAAVLWLIYLLPTWFRRNEYNATERNVVRLQQTLRILAETAEVPDEIRAEANAKSVVAHQRLLKQATVRSIPPAARAAAKIRKARAVTTGILALSLTVVTLGVVQTIISGAWIVLIAGLLASVLCITRLGRLAKLGRAVKLPARDPATVDSFVIVGAGVGGDLHFGSGAGVDGSFGDDTGSFDSEDVPSTSGESFDEGFDEQFDEAGHRFGQAATADGSVDARDGWTPVPLPKPLYTERRRLRQLSVGQLSAESFASADADTLGFAEQTATNAEQALRAAAFASEQALRAGYAVSDARAEASVANVAAEAAEAPQPESVAPSIPSRFSSMGIVDDAATGSFDVDQVLARRRAG